MAYSVSSYDVYHNEKVGAYLSATNYPKMYYVKFSSSSWSVNLTVPLETILEFEELIKQYKSRLEHNFD